MKIKVNRHTPLLRPAAEFRLGSSLLAGGPRKCLTASGGCPSTHKSLRKVLEGFPEVYLHYTP